MSTTRSLDYMVANYTLVDAIEAHKDGLVDTQTLHQFLALWADGRDTYMYDNGALLRRQPCASSPEGFAWGIDPRVAPMRNTP